MKVVGYGRCSTAEQVSNGVSIEVQRRAVAETNGWDLTWLADEGVSSGSHPNPGNDSVQRWHCWRWARSVR
jgi:DNA invertase Pin-like site-specific DNA recombinase